MESQRFFIDRPKTAFSRIRKNIEVLRAIEIRIPFGKCFVAYAASELLRLLAIHHRFCHGCHPDSSGTIYSDSVWFRGLLNKRRVHFGTKPEPTKS